MSLLRSHSRPVFLSPGWGRLAIHIVLIAGAVVMMVPYLWMVTLSLKPPELAYKAPYLIPTRLEWDNYAMPGNPRPFLSSASISIRRS
jgi:ABC-type glycerol-3-phosphate transport system permease component